MEIAIILLLVVANGIFSMAELAVVSSRKTRLQERKDNGSRGAGVAMELAAQPDDFLSTVQVGITLIGTLAGAFGGATIAGKLAQVLNSWIPVTAAYNETVAITFVVLVISYLSIVIGELVPKSLALGNAEGIASVLAPPMRFVSRLGSPAVRFLSFSTRVVMKLIPIRANNDAPVTEAEIHDLIAQGTRHGSFEEAEQEMVKGVFRLGDRRIVDLMQPRSKVVSLDVNEPWETNRQLLQNSPYSRYPLMEGELDRFIGVVHVKDIALGLLRESIDLRALARKPLIVPETAPALDVLERFQQAKDRIAVIADEHGGISGIVTLTDLLDAVMGDLRSPGEKTRPGIASREDGSWLVDGAIPVADLVEQLPWRKLPGDLDEGFTTAGGFVLAHLRRIPVPGDHFEADGWRFEVVDMDGNRIDKILVTGPDGDEPTA
jgi:putative hemolysin